MAAVGAVAFDESLIAGADLSTKQFQPVKISAKDTVVVCSAATDRCIGILQNKPTSGRGATVRLIAVKTKAVVDGTSAIAAGDFLGADANGRLIKKAANDNTYCAIANDASTAVGDIIEVWLIPIGFFRVAT